jgi:hypothetical protein
MTTLAEAAEALKEVRRKEKLTQTELAEQRSSTETPK